MLYHTIQIEDPEYRYLEQRAKAAGLSIQLFLKQLITGQQIAEKQQGHERHKPEHISTKKSRWAQCSERIRRNPPLRGAGEFVRQCSKEFREDFTFRHDEGESL